MSGRPASPVPRPGNLAAILRLGRGDATAITSFGDTPRAFIHSLLPLIALPLAIAVLTLVRGEATQALADLLAAVCALLVPPVISHLLARHWNREWHWPRFAVAYNWCQFALSVLCIALLLVIGALLGGGGARGGSNAAVVIVALLSVALVAYGLWLHWFVARTGLAISGGRAVLVVLVNYAGTFAVLVGRGLLIAERV